VSRTHDFERVRDLASRHQVVTVIGARGTGKSCLATDLEEHWSSLGMRVTRIGAQSVSSLEELLDPMSRAVGTPESGSSHTDAVARIVLDGCEQLHGRPWLTEFQERWRAMLSRAESRGRVGAVLLARPAFRQLAGGDASPLLNLGPVTCVTPMRVEDLGPSLDCGAQDAAVLLRKTGGHPALTLRLWDALEHDCSNLKSVVPRFVEDQWRYLLRLADDHSTAGVAVLRNLLETREAIPEATLLRAHFGTGFAQGLEVLADLTAAGLIGRDQEGRYRLSADILRGSAAIRAGLRAPDIVIPTGAGQPFNEAARLLFHLENQLRSVVAQELQEIDSAWWPARFPPELVASAESRRLAERESPVSSDAELHPILYVTLGELTGAIREKQNWTVLSVALGVSGGSFDECMRIVSLVRNKVAHCRELVDSDLVVLRRAAANLGLTPPGTD
jgi:hypothetical protein